MPANHNFHMFKYSSLNWYMKVHLKCFQILNLTLYSFHENVSIWIHDYTLTFLTIFINTAIKLKNNIIYTMLQYYFRYLNYQLDYLRFVSIRILSLITFKTVVHVTFWFCVHLWVQIQIVSLITECAHINVVLLFLFLQT